MSQAYIILKKAHILPGKVLKPGFVVINMSIPSIGNFDCCR